MVDKILVVVWYCYSTIYTLLGVTSVTSVSCLSYDRSVRLYFGCRSCPNKSPVQSPFSQF